MASALDIREGLDILLKYDPQSSVDAQHDELMAGGPAPEKLSLEDAKKLEDLHWRWNEEYECWARFT